MSETIADLKAKGHTHLRVTCDCGRSSWLAWASLPFSDEDVPEYHLQRFICKRIGCGKAATSCRGTSQYQGRNTAEIMGPWYKG